LCPAKVHFSSQPLDTTLLKNRDDSPYLPTIRKEKELPFPP